MLAAAAVLAVGSGCMAQGGGSSPALIARSVAGDSTMTPVNNLPNPYRTVENYMKLPAGRTWGSTSAIDVDRDGTSIWVAERCGANGAAACIANPNLDMVMKFDQNGNMTESFGAGLIMWPHGLHVDPQGNVWVTDGQDNRPRPAAAGQPAPAQPAQLKGHQVFKFSPTGQLLLTLGQAGGYPNNTSGDRFFFQPNDVLVAPDGSIFVAEGHGGNPAVNPARVLKFNAQGQLIKQWGSMGNGPGQFNQPHSLAMDSRGRLFVADRANNRVQIFDQEGNLLDTWYQFSRGSGIYIDRNDNMYVADSESGSVNPAHQPWLRGIRIGSARTGVVTAFIPDPNPACTGTCTAEGVTIDRNGVIYGAEVGPVGGVKRYEPTR